MTHRFKAFLENPDAERSDNPIHSTSGGQRHGFRSALVPGVHVLGWSVGAFVTSLGESWLGNGWVDVTFQRPVYDGDTMTVNLVRDQFTVTNPQCEVCLEGRVGVGEAPFAIEPVPWRKVAAPIDCMPELTLDNAPVGKMLRPMEVHWSADDQATFNERFLHDVNPAFSGESATCHPAWIAGQPIDLLHHSFRYGPAIHTNSQIQFVAPATVGQKFTVGGRCVDTFDKRGHHFIVNECALFGEDQAELARIRHTAIFRLRSAG